MVKEHRICMYISFSFFIFVTIIIVWKFFSIYNCFEHTLDYILSFTDKNMDANQQMFLTQITNFYTNIIELLIAINAIVLIIGFLYIRSFSKNDISNEVHTQINSDTFKNMNIKPIVNDSFTQEKNDGDISELFDLNYELVKRLEFLEKHINKEDSAVNTQR